MSQPVDNSTIQNELAKSRMEAPPITPKVTSQPFSDMYPKRSYGGPKPVVLLILDGWGIGPNNAGNAVALAKTPNLDGMWVSYPHAFVAASGLAVGLPQGEDGNSETGHLNIGAGTIVYQDLPRINTSIADGSFDNIQAFRNTIAHVKTNNSTLHLMGLIGAGGVHSNIEHLYALLNICKQAELKKVYIHGFTDGRDSPPTSGINYVRQIQEKCAALGVGTIATLMGRYFAMDRDKKWDRIETAYNALVMGAGACTKDPIGAMQVQYDSGLSDEFIEPINICDGDGSTRVIGDNDAVIFFNYRVDRPRELSRAFVMPNFEQGIKDEDFDPHQEKYEKTNIQKKDTEPTFRRQKVLQNLHFVTMTEYDDVLPVEIAFPPQKVGNPLGKILASNGLRQMRVTENEKERFVTYYMNGQEEIIFPGETRYIYPSKGVKSYDQAPEMSAREIGQEIVNRVTKDEFDVIIANICNPDMVGHTGNLKAGITACEITDEVVGKIVKSVTSRGGVVLITADHGNIEEMINNQTGEIDTEHSTNPVPLIIVGTQYMGKARVLPSGILADIAPTLLKIMGIKKPLSMTGRSLL